MCGIRRKTDELNVVFLTHFQNFGWDMGRQIVPQHCFQSFSLPSPWYYYCLEPVFESDFIKPSRFYSVIPGSWRACLLSMCPTYVLTTTNYGDTLPPGSSARLVFSQFSMFTGVIPSSIFSWFEKYVLTASTSIYKINHGNKLIVIQVNNEFKVVR